jgi:hypothetical protein
MVFMLYHLERNLLEVYITICTFCNLGHNIEETSEKSLILKREKCINCFEQEKSLRRAGGVAEW